MAFVYVRSVAGAPLEEVVNVYLGCCGRLCGQKYVDTCLFILVVWSRSISCN